MRVLGPGHQIKVFLDNLIDGAAVKNWWANWGLRKLFSFALARAVPLVCDREKASVRFAILQPQLDIVHRETKPVGSHTVQQTRSRDVAFNRQCWRRRWRRWPWCRHGAAMMAAAGRLALKKAAPPRGHRAHTASSVEHELPTRLAH